MRPDMGKVVIERPRAGGGIQYPKGEKRRLQREGGLENSPKSEHIGRKWKSTTYSKHFTDVLGPLYRYLLKQVGRPWDKIWSEICEHMPKTNIAIGHVRDHVMDFVELHAMFINGVPY